MAAANPRTIVVVRAPGAVLMPWLSRVPAVVNQLFGGQEAGTALGEALAGVINPHGKLTVSFPSSETTSWLSPPGGGPIPQTSYPGTQRGNNTWCSVDYAEGLFVGYRFYDAYPATAPPLFPFGHGLSCACGATCCCRCCCV